jgi:hypothetical protein
MNSTERLPFTQWADIHRTEKFISVEPLSGYRLVHREEDGCIFYLSPEGTDDALGQALLEALGRSRFVLPRDDPESFKREKYERCEQNWQKDFMRRYGYKTRREVYRTMDWVRAERSEGKISFQPIIAASQVIGSGLPPIKWSSFQQRRTQPRQAPRYDWP